MQRILITQAKVVNEGQIQEVDILTQDGFIWQIAPTISADKADLVIDANGKYLLPGLIDDQVHFREPGLTHKGEILTEARAAVAGGVTTYMEMPNTVPQSVTNELLEEKYQIAAQRSLANYSFYLGGTNNNLEELLKINKEWVCGVKVFMGSSTGNMLVDDPETLEKIFANVNSLIATHCENDVMIQQNTDAYRAKYGEGIPSTYHPQIRSAEACWSSSSMAVALAKKHHTRLHILHISTAKETSLFANEVPLAEKRITSEACIHHLWFSDADYAQKGNFIKWNPAVKTAADRDGIWQALLDDRIDVIATDHAPHTLAEKSKGYFEAPSGGPLIQHSLLALLDFYHEGKITLEQIVQKACHNPAILFGVRERGYIREGYWADLVLADLSSPTPVDKSQLRYKCGWSPFEGHTFQSSITHTIVSGHLAYANGQFDQSIMGKRLQFDR